MVHRLIAVAGLAVGAGCATDGTYEEDERQSGIEAVAQRYQMRLSADGTMPANGLWEAKLRRDEMVAAGGGGADGSWTWIGPGNVGGRLRSILISPADPSIMYVGAAGGGVWKTTNGGTAWSPLPDFVPSLAIGCMVFDPADPNTLYVGTGEGVFDTLEGTSNTAAPRGAGVLKSTDAGQTWAQLPSTANADWYYVNRLAFQPGSNQMLVAATNSGIWRSLDAGGSWTRRTTTQTYDVEFDPNNAQKAVAGGHDGLAQYSLDGGATWLAATGIPATAHRVELTYAPSNTSIVYAGVSTGTNMRIYRSTDGGLTYVLMTTSPAAGPSTLGDYTGVVWVDPLNPATLLLGTQGLYRSLNSGATLTSTFSGVHADHHFIATHPQYNGTTNKIIYFAGDGGIYRATDSGGSAVTNLNNNMGVTQFYGTAVNNTSGVVIAGAQDNGTNRFTGNPQAWTLNVIGGDGAYCASDPTDPNYFYGESQRLAISRSSNGGATFPSSVAGGIGDRGSTTLCNFIPFFMLDPNDPNRMLAAGRSLWRSNNVKTGAPPVWTAIKTPLLLGPPPPPVMREREFPRDHYVANDPRNIAAIAVAEGNPNVIWVGHNNGQVWRSTDGTAATPTWTRVDMNPPGLPGRWISRIVIDRNNHNRVYVAVMGFTPDNVWRTTDGGATWQVIAGSGPGALPSVPATALAQHRLTPSHLIVGTDVGLFESNDDGSSWAPISPEVGLVEIAELVWRNDTTLVVATHGRGVYSGTIPAGTPCYANCDGSTTAPVLNVADFACFLNRFAAGDSYANCDGSTAAPVLNVADFACFLNAFAAGCT